MGVYIPGMEMPTSCGDCRFFAWKRGVGQHCAVASDITFHATIDGMDVAYERKGNCPLVPVPPHGRLIAADALKASLVFAESTAEWAVPALRAVLMVIDEMPTVIPEAKEGEG